MKKRMIAMLLAVAMLLTMTGCGSRERGSRSRDGIEGTWIFEISMEKVKELIVRVGTDENINEIAEIMMYVDMEDLYFPLTMDFSKDGRLKLSVDSDAIGEMSDELAETFLNAMEMYMEEEMYEGAFEAYLAEEGITRSAALKMVSAALEVAVFEINQELKDVNLIYEDRADEGQICLRDADRGESGEDPCFDYTMQGGKLIITGCSKLEALGEETLGFDPAELFPITLTAA